MKEDLKCLYLYNAISEAEYKDGIKLLRHIQLDNDGIKLSENRKVKNMSMLKSKLRQRNSEVYINWMFKNYYIG